MWIFTVNGFFTVIQDRKDPNYVWLRSRLREDIERNFPGVTAQEHPGADYLYRVKLPREQVAQRLFELAMENNVTSHFKDVMIKTASKPEFGSRSQMLYGVWNAGAAMQPIPPYSKARRSKPVQQPHKASRQPGAGQTGIGLTPYTYGGNGTGYYGSDFDWQSGDWGGRQAKDPAPVSRPGQHATDEEFEEWWGSLTDDEREAFLDEAEAEQRQREELEEDFGAAARALEFSAAEVVDVHPAPRNRPGNRKQRRRERRAATRRDKDGTGKTTEQRTQEYRRLGHSSSEAAQMAADRQTFLARKYGPKGDRTDIHPGFSRQGEGKA
jgi:hypothetical protein